jgi:alpha/beta superfamily hydrolase
MVAQLPEPKKLVIIEGGDHFFAGHLVEMRDTIAEWVISKGLGARG